MIAKKKKKKECITFYVQINVCERIRIKVQMSSIQRFLSNCALKQYFYLFRES